ncbi:hypothetical protein RIF29_25326 [Crotalaria pallida]|uniref:Uncharacterized protein n=1 Tax=Crotalaria pallida TaxID=3830 RepID=A0AAN9ETK1_CROPI
MLAGLLIELLPLPKLSMSQMKQSHQYVQHVALIAFLFFLVAAIYQRRQEVVQEFAGVKRSVCKRMQFISEGNKFFELVAAIYQRRNNSVFNYATKNKESKISIFSSQ